MKNLLSTVVLVMLFMSLTACNGDGDKVDLIPVKNSKTGNWSMLSADGKIKYDAEFKNEPSICYNGVFTVPNDDGTYTLYDAQGESPKEVPGCDSLYQAGSMSEGVIPITQKGKHIELVNKKGETIATLDKCDGQQITRCFPSISSGLLGVEVVGRKCGFVNKKGETVVKPKYQIASSFTDGYAAVGTRDDDGNENFQIIDTEGKTVVPIKDKYTLVTTMLKGYMVLKDPEAERYCMMDKEGNITKLPDKVDEYVDFNGKYMIFKCNNQYGAVDTKGEIVIRAKYYKLKLFEDDSFWAQKDSDSGFVKLNTKGETIAEIDQTFISDYFPGFGFFGKDGKTWNLIDDHGKTVGNEDFYDVSEKTTCCDMVESDYFDFQAIADETVEYVTSNKLKFGEKPQKVFSDVTPDYSYANDEAAMKSESTEGYKYTRSVYARSSKPMAQWDTSGYVWNPAAVLDTYDIYVNTEKKGGLTKDEFNTIVKSFESKGFKKVKISEKTNSDVVVSISLLAKGDTAVLVFVVTGKQDFTIVTFPKSNTLFWNNALEMIASN